MFDYENSIKNSNIAIEIMRWVYNGRDLQDEEGNLIMSEGKILIPFSKENAKIRKELGVTSSTFSNRTPDLNIFNFFWMR